MTGEALPVVTGGLRAGPLLTAMRPAQWPKNGIVFAALAFSAGVAWEADRPADWWPLLWRSAALFALWCVAASAVYLVNDVLDREADREHPRKRGRPVASGELSAGAAIRTAIVLTAVAAPLGLALDLVAGSVIAGYVVVMVVYSLGLKTVPILDVIILAGGVVARAASGATAIDVEISPWLYVCTGFAAFFFATSKRWAEVRLLGEDVARHRPALAEYPVAILDQIVVISAAAALIGYALYTIESANVPANGAMALTIPFVAFALFRYLYLLDGPRKGDPPDQILFTDRQILSALAGFLMTAVVVLLVT